MKVEEKNDKFYENPIFLNFFLISVNVSLFISKLIFSMFSNSLALQADAFDNLTDIVLTIAALIGIIYSKKKPNEKFPYGYYKIENIVSLIISFFIFFTAYTIISRSIEEVFLFSSGNLKIIKVSPSIFTFVILSFCITLLISFYLNFMSRKSNSPIIKSEANEKLYDNLISFSVIIGFIGAFFNLFLIDSIIGLFIALFIIKGGYDIFLTSTKTLLDAVIEFNERTQLYNLIETFPKVKKIENMEIRSYGRYIFLELTISLNKDLPLSQIQALKKLITEKIRTEFPQIFKIVVMTQSQEKNLIKVAVPVLDNNGLNSSISEHFGESSYFAFFEIQEGENGNQLLNYNIISNEFIQEEKRKGILISDWLISSKIDKIYLKKDLKVGPKLIFEKGLILMEITKFDKLDEIINHELKLSKYP